MCLSAVITWVLIDMHGQVKIDNPTISGVHCKLVREDEQKEEEEGGGFNKVIWLEDCSTNGTFVGHDRVGKGKRARLVSGTQVSHLIQTSPCACMLPSVSVSWSIHPSIHLAINQSL
jgi:hypothetical protein